MRYMRGWLLALLIIFWPALSYALPDEEGEYTKFGAGNFPCDVLMHAQQGGDAQGQSWPIIIVSWVQGFLTAYNLYGSLAITRLADPEDSEKWVNNYCLQHPLSTLSGAAQALVAELHKQKTAF